MLRIAGCVASGFLGLTSGPNRSGWSTSRRPSLAATYLDTFGRPRQRWLLEGVEAGDDTLYVPFASSSILWAPPARTHTNPQTLHGTGIVTYTYLIHDSSQSNCTFPLIPSRDDLGLLEPWALSRFQLLPPRASSRWHQCLGQSGSTWMTRCFAHRHYPYPDTTHGTAIGLPIRPGVVDWGVN